MKHRRKLEREKKHAVAAEFDFVPSTFVLPGDYALFVEEFKRRPGVREHILLMLCTDLWGFLHVMDCTAELKQNWMCSLFGS